MNKYAKTIATVKTNASVCPKQNHINNLTSNVPTSNSAITLIALIITIIVLLILAGVTLNMVMGENGIFGKANWSKFVTNFNSEQEAVDLYSMQKNIDKYVDKTEIKLSKIYPTKDKRISNDDSEISEGLKETIKNIENINEITEENVELYNVDKKLINSTSKDDYIVNVKSGKIYLIKPFKFNGLNYYRPEQGLKETNEGLIGIAIKNIQISNEYQFTQQKDSKVEVNFDIEIPEEIQGNIPIITVDKDTTGEVEGKLSEGKYIGTIKPSDNQSPNGTYTYTVTVNNEGTEYKATKRIVIDRFLNNPEIEIENKEESYSRFTIKIKNEYPKEANIKYKYYIKEENEVQYNELSTNIESNTNKNVTDRQATTKYNVKVEAYLNDEKTKVESIIDYTTPEQISKIYTINDLEKVNTTDGLSGSWELMNDLDFKEASSYKDGESDERYIYYNTTDESGNLTNSWTPIGTSSIPFTGKFNGNYHKIKNIYIYTKSEKGLFGYARGVEKDVVMQNLIIDGITIGGSHNKKIGGLLGCGISDKNNSKYNGSFKIERIKVNNLKLLDTNGGSGIVGNTERLVNGAEGDIIISECVVTNAVALRNSSTSGWFNGIVNDLKGTVENCYVSAEANYCKPIIQYARLGASVRNCYANIKSQSKLTGLDIETTDKVSIEKLFYNNTLYPNYTPTSETPIIDENLKKMSTYADWDISNERDSSKSNSIWYIDDGNDYPILRWELEHH